MVRRIVTFALHQPLFLLLLVVLFIASGLVAFNTLPIEAFPDVTDIQVSVITLFPGHAPEEVEKQVTIQGGADDPDLAAAVAAVTQNLLGPQGAFRAIETGRPPVQGLR